MKGLPYHGPCVDAWSCGVVLFVLLVGNTPWDEPTAYSPEYRIYKTGDHSKLNFDPWTRLNPGVMCMSTPRIADISFDLWIDVHQC